jgi:hypothetical protein
MRALIRSIGLIGPGLPDWASSIALLRGETPYQAAEVQLPAVSALPPAERRRTGAPVRLALSTGLQALSAGTMSATDVATIFTSSGGDGQVIHEICEVLATEAREVSPTRFHNSVHNAPAGYWGIATRSHAASTSLCAYDWSFAAGLLEACAQVQYGSKPVLLVSYDVPYPPPLREARPVHGVLGIALLLDELGAARGVASVNVEFNAERASATRMENHELEALRQGNPTGRALPLLAAIATGASTDIALDYLDATLRIHIGRE